MSRSYATYVRPARRYGFAGFSPYAKPDVIEVAEGIPFADLTHCDVPATLYGLKGEIVQRGIRARHRIRYADLPEAPLPARDYACRRHARAWIGQDESSYRRTFYGLYA